ncbi:MAG: hypothetical protein AAGD32_14085 [Planctomycetota bacterium]
MRTLILIVVTVLLIAGGFLAVTVLLPDPQIGGSEQSSLIEVDALQRTEGGLTAAGEGTTYKRFSGSRLVQEFHAEKFEPTRDNQVKVENPRLTFYLADGRQVIVRAEVGTLETAGKIDLEGDAAAPRQGLMRDVQIEMTEPGNDGPILRAHVDNLRFDAETMELATADSEINGRPVLGEQVPVIVRGRDYDFDGRGLLVRWNDADGRLELLRITRGDKLVIKDPALLRQLQTETAAVDPTKMYATAQGLPEQEPYTVYEASFRNDVIITQGQQRLVDAESLVALFAMDQLTDESEPEEPTDQGSAKSAKKKSTPSAESEPTPQANTPLPLVMTWQGEFVVLPASEARSTLLAGADDWRAMLTGKPSGAPVVVQRDGLSVTAPRLEYASITDSVIASAAEYEPPVEVLGEDGLRLETRGIEFNGAANTARLVGASWAMIPMAGDDGTDQILKAAWTKRCRIEIDRAADGAMAVRGIDLAGAVDVSHPQADLTSERLSMKFAAPKPGMRTNANRPADLSANGGLGDAMTGLGELETIVAEEDVVAVLRSTNPDEEPRRIKGQTLTLLTAPGPDGDPVLRTIEADGGVELVDAQGKLNAGTVVADLNALADGTVEVVSLEARDEVRLEQDGVLATAAVLQGRGVGDQALYRLAGPEVVLRRGAETFVCKTVLYAPATGAVEVPDGGRIETLFAPEDGGTPTPMRAKFAGSATLQPETDRVLVEGPIQIEADAEDGSLVTAIGDRLELLLDPAGTTERPQVKSAVLLGNIDLNKVLRGPDGRILQRVHVLTERLDFDAATETVTIPVAGRMLYEDFTPAAEPAAGGADPRQKFGEFRGSAGLVWDDRLVYQRGPGDLKILGDVKMVAKPTADGPSERYRVRADRVDAKLVETAEQIEVNTASVSGDVDFAAPDLKFLGGIVRYDADNGFMVITGVNGQPFELLQNDGTSRAMVGELIYDTTAGQIVAMKDVRGRMMQ